MKSKIVNLIKDGEELYAIGSEGYIQHIIESADQIISILEIECTPQKMHELQGMTPEQLVNMLMNEMDNNIMTLYPN